MYKCIRRWAALLLAASIIAGSSFVSLAAESDATTGPAFDADLLSKVGQEVPSTDTSGQDSSASQESPAQDGGQGQDGSTEGAQGDGTTSDDGQDVSVAEEDAAQAAAEAAAAAEEAARQAAIIANTPYLQIQVLTPDMQWTNPVIGDDFVQTGDQGFLSMCIYLNNIVGNVLYRTYSAPNGWTQWAMNGGHTTLWPDGSKVEAFQIRFTGFVDNMFDIYYTSVLNDGATMDWAGNGNSSGTMAAGKYISSFRVSLWGVNSGAWPYAMDRPVDSAAPDGIFFDENGAAYFSSGTGAPYTGWAWNNRDRYYVVNNVPVTGWQYIDGYKYYFDESGKVVSDLEPLIGANGPFLIRINKEMNTTTVYVQDGANGFIIPLKSFLCSTGDDTPVGTFKTPEKYRWRLMNSGVYCQYATRLGSGLSFLLHSIIYDRPDVNTLHPETYNFLGVVRSAGCIRYLSSDAKWIYDHCPIGTTIEVYNSPIPGPYERPAIEQIIPTTQTWDPSDPVAAAQHQQ